MKVYHVRYNRQCSHCAHQDSKHHFRIPPLLHVAISCYVLDSPSRGAQIQRAWRRQHVDPLLSTCGRLGLRDFFLFFYLEAHLQCSLSFLGLICTVIRGSFGL
ncbi:hypothetical protein L211DRAFT_177259 [Terfezia boudieri ATCC MYA-4762]|uniref:Uncharacterized protein n=1 Tax=Terfezia boudieri ATCC MYA-4762 TaxID=1051890 RepID=A0A3N4LSB9_9PEZI|nr:hypothetical protein L211DRAFT_177259 [Terfezia boudieri ATCC MYA-4762]